MKTLVLNIAMLLQIGCSSSQNKDVRQDRNIRDSTTYSYKMFSTLKGDTLNYIRENFISKKKFYENKPLSILLKNVELPITSHNPTFGNPPNVEQVMGIHLRFDTEVTELSKFNKKKTPNSLLILLKQPINYKEAVSILKKNGRNWTNDSQDFYGKFTIEDIMFIGNRN